MAQGAGAGTGPLRWGKTLKAPAWFSTVKPRTQIRGLLMIGMRKFPFTACGAEFPTEEALLAHVGEYHGKGDGAAEDAAGAARTIEFPKEVKEFASKEYREWREAESLTEEEKRVKFGRAVRVSAKYLPSARKELRSGDLVWFSDSPKAGGGLGEHPGALQHFVAGLPACQLVHYGERASGGGLRIEEVEISAIGRYLAMSGRGFDSVEYEVRISSPEPPDRVKELASAAAGDCYVTNTLKRSCKVTGKVVLNGQHLADLP